MRIRVGQLDANPFRRIEHYPIREDKITALRESIASTGFWDNLVGRQVGDRVQIAYGHHRREALLREYGPDAEVDIVTRDLPDELMLKIMANENMSEWGSSAQIEHETIRSVVQAYADGRIRLEVPAGVGDGLLRHAPSFVQGDGFADRESLPYTAQTVAHFLGWVESPGGKAQRRVYDALSALEFIEKGALSPASFEGLTSYQASAVVQQARKAAKDSELRAKVARQAAQKQAAAAEAARLAADAAEQQASAARQARDEQAAADARRREAEQRKTQREAQRNAERAQAASTAHQAEARKAASVAGGDVGAAFRSDKTTYKTAHKAASRTQPERPPLNIDTYADRMAGRIHKMLDADHHVLGQQLDELVRFREHLSPAAKLDLVRELASLSARVEQYRAKLSSGVKDASPDRAPDIEILDAEVTEDHIQRKELTQ